MKKVIVKRALCNFRLKCVKIWDIIYYVVRITVNLPSKQPTESVSYRNIVTDVLVYVTELVRLSLYIPVKWSYKQLIDI